MRAKVVCQAGKMIDEKWVEMSDATEAIDDAQALYEDKDFAGAVALLEKALTMAGSGVKRDRSKPAELSLGERQSIFYNLTANHALLNDVPKAARCLELLFDSGYGNPKLYGIARAAEDAQRLAVDSDLANLRADVIFAELVSKYSASPSALAVQLDPGSSSVGRAIKGVNDKFKA